MRVLRLYLVWTPLFSVTVRGPKKIKLVRSCELRQKQEACRSQKAEVEYSYVLSTNQIA